MTDAMDRNESLMDYITRCIDRCGKQFGEYGSKYDSLNTVTQLNVILSKYCARQAVAKEHTSTVMSHTYHGVFLCQIFSSLCLKMAKPSNHFVLRYYRDELQKARKMILT